MVTIGYPPSDDASMYSSQGTYPIEILMSLKNDVFLTFDLTQTDKATNYFFSYDPLYSRGNIQLDLFVNYLINKVFPLLRNFRKILKSRNPNLSSFHSPFCFTDIHLYKEVFSFKYFN